MDERSESKSVGETSRDEGGVTVSGAGNDSARAPEDGGDQVVRKGAIEKGSMPEDVDVEEEDLGTLFGKFERERGARGAEDSRGGEIVGMTAADTTSMRSETDVCHSEGGDDRGRGEKTHDGRAHASPKVMAGRESSKVRRAGAMARWKPGVFKHWGVRRLVDG